MATPLGIVILAGGMGSRMQSSVPKLLQPVAGAPMLEYAIDACRNVQPMPNLFGMVTGPHNGELIEGYVGNYAPEILFARQEAAKGTGDAVLSSRSLFEELIENDGDLLVVMGDVPLVTSLTLSRSIAYHRSKGNVATAVTMNVQDPDGYGRIIHGPKMTVTIREDADADEVEKFVTEVNTGILVFKAAPLFEVLPLLGQNNASHEIYLSETFELLASHGTAGAFLVDETVELPNINTFIQLAETDRLVRRRILEKHMKNGVRILDPDNTYIDKGVKIGPGTTIYPFTVIRRGVEVGENCEIGPFAHLRGDTLLQENCVVGNFVECKNSNLGSGTKAKHLTYLGDLTTGKKVNIGAGTVICNYDGKQKHKTEIGDNSFLGSGTMVIAPRKIGDNAQTGAGAVVTKDVEKNERVAGVPAKRLNERKEG